MSQSSNIPLIHASVCEPVLLAGRTIGTPIEKIFRAVNMTSKILDNPFLLVPEISAWNMIRAISQLEDEPLFGLKATSELAVYDYESVKALIGNCINLKMLLERFCAITPIVSSTANYKLKEDGNLVWLIQVGARLIADYRQIELFEVGEMIQLVQLTTGENWRPKEIHFASGYCKHIDNAEQLNPARIRFSQQFPAIAIPKNLLPLSVPAIHNSNHSNSIPSQPETMARSLLQAITPYIGERQLNHQLLSDITGMSSRTLQRKLAHDGENYSRILDQARFQKAQLLLTTTDEQLMSISLKLGYENASSFTRSFKRWAGITPIEYRKHLLA